MQHSGVGLRQGLLLFTTAVCAHDCCVCQAAEPYTSGKLLIPPPLAPQERSDYVHSQGQLLQGSVNLNSGPCASAAGTLPPEPFPRQIIKFL